MRARVRCLIRSYGLGRSSGRMNTAMKSRSSGTKNRVAERTTLGSSLVAESTCGLPLPRRQAPLPW